MLNAELWFFPSCGRIRCNFFSRLIVVTSINLRTMNSLRSSRIRIDVSMSKKKPLYYSIIAKTYRLLFSKILQPRAIQGLIKGKKRFLQYLKD